MKAFIKEQFSPFSTRIDNPYGSRIALPIGRRIATNILWTTLIVVGLFCLVMIVPA